ncbi:MAG: alanine racemase [Opitutaceae bacterium]|nr:alanine racemase [Opitutaceae bacterium]
MSSAIDALQTPSVLIDLRRLEGNIRTMQAACDEYGVELRPHLKTHKMVEVARRQLAAGARGLTCAKLGEAEAMLPSGVRQMFVAHSLVDPLQAPRIAALADRLDELQLAVTSEAQAEAFLNVAQKVGRKIPVFMAVDTGLGREGVRDRATADRLARRLARSPHVELRGFYTHEGNLYGAAPAEQRDRVEDVITRLSAIRDAIDPGLPIWPGCSVSARLMVGASRGRVQAVRPGAYVFGDIYLTRITGVMQPEDVALHVLVTVVDKPEPGLALIDAGSKTFSSDRTPETLFAIDADGRDLAVVRVNEEHGYLRGSAVEALRIGERVRLTPAHVCPVVNLTDDVQVIADDRVVDTWRVEARGRVQ